MRDRHDAPWRGGWGPGPGSEAWTGFRRRVFVRAAVAAAFLGGALFVAGAVFAALVSSASVTTIVVAGAVLVVVVGVGARAGARTWGPVRALIDATAALADGDYTVRVDGQRSAMLRPVATSFNEMASRLEDADRQRRQLIADLGHELRTPLTVVRGEIEAMLDGVHRPDPDHLSMLLDEVTVMERLIEDLRTLSATSAGALTLYPEATDLASLVDDVADSYRRRATEAGIDVVVTGGEVPELELDPVRIREVLANLVLNAINAMPGGGTLTMHTSRRGNRVLVEVGDTGVGIAAADLDRVFDRFHRGADSSGTGLGLTISRDLVAAHGGTIAIDSDVGTGTTVTLAFPIG